MMKSFSAYKIKRFQISSLRFMRRYSDDAKKSIAITKQTSAKISETSEGSGKVTPYHHHHHNNTNPLYIQKNGNNFHSREGIIGKHLNLSSVANDDCVDAKEVVDIKIPMRAYKKCQFYEKPLVCLVKTEKRYGVDFNSEEPPLISTHIDALGIIESTFNSKVFDGQNEIKTIDEDGQSKNDSAVVLISDGQGDSSNSDGNMKGIGGSDVTGIGKDPCQKEPTKQGLKASKGGCFDDGKKKDDPCKGNVEKKEDPCKKKEEKKADPCLKKETKKEDPCKKKEEKKADPCKPPEKKVDSSKPPEKKVDPCKKEEKKADICKKEEKKVDPCKPPEKRGQSGKKEEKKPDPCKIMNEKKADPCKKEEKKADICKKEEKKVDPCKKKEEKKADPCKIKDEKKADPCKKKEEKKADQSKNEANKPDPCKLLQKKDDACQKSEKKAEKTEPTKPKKPVCRPPPKCAKAKRSEALFWRNVSLFGALPFLLLITGLVFSSKQEHERPEFIKYTYLRLRNKRFPWGEDGMKSLFHNPKVNALPDGYEEDEDEEEHEAPAAEETKVAPIDPEIAKAEKAAAEKAAAEAKEVVEKEAAELKEKEQEAHAEAEAKEKKE